MDATSEKNSKRVLATGVLFAVVGLLALGITLMQPSVSDERAQNPDDIFGEYTVEEKAEILANVSASSTGADIPEEEKLRILESLNSQ